MSRREILAGVAVADVFAPGSTRQLETRASVEAGQHLEVPQSFSTHREHDAATQTKGSTGGAPFSSNASLHIGSGDGEVIMGASAGVDGNVALMENVPENKQVFMQYSDVSAWVPGSFAVPGLLPKLSSVKNFFSRKKDDFPMRQILYGITGCCRPGEVLAFMGPSGSGKTSLLSIIGGRAQSMMQKEGAINFNGSPPNKNMKRSMGFVMQDDLLYESLTVFEVLFYAAQLRLPRTMSKADKRIRVETVITSLGLDSCKDTIIGGFFRKGISGGERKRCSVGHELLINPSILLLDEPTSGLDSTTAMHLLTSLRKLAQGGRSIITTIHQPSSRLFQQLDKLLLLSKGHAMYYGSAKEAIGWFGRLGYKLPYGINAADFILDLASSDVATQKRDGEESREYLIELYEAYVGQQHSDGFQSHTADRDIPAIRASLDLPHSPTRSSKKLMVPAPISAGHEYDEHAEPGPFSSKEHADIESGKGGGMGSAFGEGGDRWGAPYRVQFMVLLSRSIRVRRFQALSTQDIAQLLILGTLAGLFWLQKAKSDTVFGAQQTLGLLFFELLFMSFRSLFAALFTFPEERKMLLKERASGMYRLSAFYFARLASDLPMDFAVPTIFVVLVYFISGLRVDSGIYFFQNWFTIVLIMFVTQSFGLLLGTVVMVPKTAQTIASVVMLTFVLTAGYFVKTIPAWISWLKYLSFVFYGFGLLLHIEFNGRTIYSCVETNTCTQLDPSNPSGDPICTPVNIQDALHLNQDPNDSKWVAIDVVVLFAFLIIIRVAVYYFLRKKTARV